MAILRAADAVDRRMAAVLEPYGLTGQQYNVLRILRGAHPDALPTLEIAERMIEQSPGVTRLLDRLEEKRLVRRERSNEDRRLVRCSITPDGLTLLKRLDRPVQEVNAHVLASLTASEVGHLSRLLDRVGRGE